jgi:hypothetical protein
MTPALTRRGELVERFPAREDLVDALRGVGQNAGAPGTDGMKTEQLPGRG